MTALFWHVSFLIGMGFVSSYLLLSKTNTLNNTYSSSDIPINIGFGLFFYGVLYGSVDYLSGIAVSYYKGKIMKMVSFTGKEYTKTTTISMTVNDPSGQTPTTATITKYGDYFKNFLALDEMLSKWPDLFWAQHMLQIFLPYVYLMMLEGSVLIVFFFTLLAQF